ncbi:SDR family NAD(P)-dependent oxidoreductase [Xylocopilactobacillus apicola]|uniref:Short-chain dehydrogenase n=1 Tax=Xylocopilactobacillus apicola TaxID=2932184 RepID=A0AAU9DYH7_9LACO|nr:SDR family oxidoreductase [Xylocopilactobacillus apicola]BDR59238.1 short-chain dehydrogenase [Xylocopilactobacillus apicola]
MAKRVVIVTGATSGIGFVVAKLLVQRHYFVVMVGRSSERLLQSQAKIDPKRESSEIMSCDLSQQKAIKRLVQIVSDKYIVTALINLAGSGHFKTVLETSDDEIAQTFAANTLGLIYLTKGIAALMVAQGFGQIINVASMAGKLTTPKATIYGSSKAAVIAFSNGLRLELRSKGVKVSTVNTGPVATPFLTKADPSGNYEHSVAPYLLSSKVVAKKIASLLERYQREVNLPWYMEAAAKFYPFVPHLGDYLAGVVFNKK